MKINWRFPLKIMVVRLKAKSFSLFFYVNEEFCKRLLASSKNQIIGIVMKM
jgi:hypothetical protein